MSSSLTLYQSLLELCENVKTCLAEVQELDVASKFLINNYLSDPEELESSQIIKIQAVLDYMTEQVNIGNWQEVRPFLRKTITIVSYIKVLAHIKCAKKFNEDIVKESYKILDNGILFGCPLDKEPQLLQNCAAILRMFDVPKPKETPNITIENASETDNSKYNGSLLETLDCPSMEYFYKNHILAELPVVLDNCINHWPSLTKWKDQAYFIKLGGQRTVPIEIGKDYTDADWTQKLMTIEEFITNHIYKSDGNTGYLAQYHLFEHIPELKKDITEPEYCCFTEKNSLPDIMAWYGPKGTITPLHYDSKKNLLAQVIGQKLIFLFAPNDKDNLYQNEDELLYNSAKIDPRCPDMETFPKYKDAKPYYCILKPGQMLYIPPKWWHFVESLSLSFSVSFWWQ